MGMNYYWHNTKKEFSSSVIRIGKSSCGWHFQLHVYPELNINTLEDWKYLFDKKFSCIKNENGAIFSKEDMIQIISKRSFKRGTKEFWHPFYSSEKEFLNKNYAEYGYNGLIRSKIDNIYCISHGEGTWDCVVGGFS